ncbi:MAG: hybrid sensor histidine kinase/response regulator [Rhodothermales bacterium]
MSKITSSRYDASRTTQHEQAEHALRESEARFRAVTQNALDIIAVMDEEGCVMYLSPSVEAVLGYAPEELLGGQLVEQLSPDEVHYLRNQLTQVLLQAEAVVTLSFAFKHKNGEVRHLSAKAKNLLGSPGIDGILLNIRDVTEHKQFEQELIQARKVAEEMTRLKSTLFANMSHEIRTPLTAIVGFASLLEKEVEEPHREFAQLIGSGSRQLMDMLNAVLTLAKLEADQVEMEFDALSVHDEAQTIVQIFSPLAHQQGLTIQFESTEAGRRAKARLDRGAFSSIMHNLLSNALKFTEKGTVTVSVDAEGPAQEGRVVLQVQDSGEGIDPNFLPYLFDEFRQESTGIGRAHGGSGLGLAITKQLVTLMHGEIDVRSEKGKGSTFSVTLPSTEKALEETSAAAQPSVAPSEEARLLIVEDNEDTGMLMQAVLESMGEVTLAVNAQEALEAASKTPHHAVLLDINLGRGPNGTDVLRELRAMPTYRDAPIAALTAYALPGDRERFLAMGFSRYLSKPFTVDELLALVSDLLSQRA